MASGDDGEKPLVSALEPLFGYQLRRASAAVLADLNRALADLELRPAEASIIVLIEDNPDITQSELGRILGIQRANMAPLAATLIDRGIVDRAPANGRGQALRLSGGGLALARKVRARITAHEAGLLPELGPEERSAMVRLLRQIWS